MALGRHVQIIAKKIYKFGPERLLQFIVWLVALLRSIRADLNLIQFLNGFFSLDFKLDIGIQRAEARLYQICNLYAMLKRNIRDSGRYGVINNTTPFSSLLPLIFPRLQGVGNLME